MSPKKRVPAWVHRAKTQALLLSFSAGDEHRDRLIEIIRKLAECTDLANAWTALEKRFDASEAIRVEQVRALFQPMEGHPGMEHQPPKLTPEQHVHALAEACFLALNGFVGYENISADQRGEKAKNLIDLAQALARELRKMEHPIFGLPPEFDLTTVGYEIGAETYTQLHEKYDQGEDWNKGYLAGAFDFSPAAANDLPRLLDALVSRVKVWGESPPIVSKPSLNTAKRGYFIKNLLIYFNDTYGAEMPAAVLAFTGVFFEDARSMKINRITAMSPVKKVLASRQ